MLQLYGSLKYRYGVDAGCRKEMRQTIPSVTCGRLLKNGSQKKTPQAVKLAGFIDGTRRGIRTPDQLRVKQPLYH